MNLFKALLFFLVGVAVIAVASVWIEEAVGGPWWVSVVINAPGGFWVGWQSARIHNGG